MLNDETVKVEEQAVLVDSRGMTPRQANMIDMDTIASKHGYTVHDILGKSKLKALVAVRRKCVVMLRNRGYSTTEIGRIMNRDHSTIVHAIQMSKAEA